MSHVAITEPPEKVDVASIGDLKTPDLRIVAFSSPLRDKTPTGVASHVLYALGNDPTVNGKAQHTSDVRHLVPVWLMAHRTETLYVIAPQHSHPNSLRSLIEMCAASPTRLVFAIDRGYRNQFAKTISYATPEIIPWPDTNVLQHPEEQPFIGWNPEHRNQMPTDDYLTFYAQCEKQLPLGIFEEVHGLYVESLNRTLQWIKAVGASDLQVEDVRDAMAVLSGEQTNTSEVIVALRAAQAAFHRNGWMLKYDDSSILHNLLRFPPCEPTLAMWRRLRAYRKPDAASSVALYLCGMTVDEINRLTLRDLTTWHQTGNPIAGITVHPEAAPYLRAHLFNSIANDPDPDRLALGKINPNGHTNSKVRFDIREAGKKLGTDIGDAVTLSDVSRTNRHVGTTTFQLELIA